MRDLLTWLGIALIVLLSAALAAPYLVDAEALRLPLAARFSQASGALVRLDGPIAFKLLPTPRLEAENFSLSGAQGSLRAHQAIIELSLSSLVQGKLHVATAHFDGGDVLVSSEASPGSAPPVDQLSLKNFRVALTSGNRVSSQIFGVDLEGALAGGLALRGAFNGEGERIGFALNMENVSAQKKAPLKARLSWPEDRAVATLDGVALLAPHLAFEGAATLDAKILSGVVSAKATAVLGADGLWLRDIDARLGEGPLAPKISGSLRYGLDNGPKLTLALAADHLDAPWSDGLEGFLTPAAPRPQNLDLRLAIAAASWRGVDWSDVQILASPGAPLELRAGAPGGTRLKWRARHDDGFFRGPFSLTSDDFASFAAAVPALAGASAHHVELAGDLAVAAGDWRVTEAKIALDGASFSGALAYQNAPRPKITAALAAAELDIDAAPSFSAFSGQNTDFDLQVSATKLASSRLRAEGGRLDAHILREGAHVLLDRLDIFAPGGANLNAAGSWDQSFSHLTGAARLKAGDLTQLAGVTARLFPGAWSAHLAQRAKILSPAEFSARADASGLAVEGAFAATKFALSAPDIAAPEQNFHLDCSAPEAGALLAQLGVDTVFPQKKLGPARISLLNRQGGDTFSGIADLAGLHAEFLGARRAGVVEGEARLSGASDVLAALDLPLSPLDLAAHVKAERAALQLSQIAGAVAGAKISGELVLDADGARGKIATDVLSAPALLALVLGPPAPAKAGALWSTLSFAPVLIDPPPLKLAIATQRLAPLDGPAHFDLTLGPGRLSVGAAEMALRGGFLRGEADLRRSAGQATLRGAIQAEDVTIANPAVSAKLDGAMSFAAGGGDAAALIGSLAGDGALTLRDLKLAEAASGASEKILRASLFDDASFDAQKPARDLDRNFAEAPLQRHKADFSARLASGVLSLISKNAEAAGLEGRFDLRDATFLASLRDPLAAGPEEAAGVVSWSGPWLSPSRKVDASGLVNLLALRALEREHRKIERQKAEDRARLLLAPAPLPPLQADQPRK